MLNQKSHKLIENQHQISNGMKRSYRSPLKAISPNKQVQSSLNKNSTLEKKKAYWLYQNNYPSLPPFYHIEIPIGASKNAQDAIEYEHIIYRTMRSNENARKIHKFNQLEITMKDRNVMIDALCRFHFKLGLITNTFYRFLGIFDKYLSIAQVPRKALKLYACASLLIASKIEDIYPCLSSDLILLTGESFTQQELFNAEVKVLNTISFETTFATPLFYLTQFMRIHKKKETQTTILLARYILEIMQSCEHFYGVLPAFQASVAVMVTRILKGEREKWTKELAGYTQFTEDDLYPYALHVRSMLLEEDREETKTIKRKYSSKNFFGVANVYIPSNFI